MIEFAPLQLPHHVLLERRKEMKRTVICLVVVLLLVSVANAQTKSMTGTVIDYSVGNRGTWAGITIKVGNKKYFVYTESTEAPTPEIVGKVDEVGRTVQVFYTRIVNSPNSDGELRATKIVEIKEQRSSSARGSDGDSLAMPVREFVMLDPVKQKRILEVEYNKTIKNLLKTLRSSKDSKGVEKSAERYERDRKRADMIVEIASNVDGKELSDRFTDAAIRVPDAELSDVIIGFFFDKVKEREANAAKNKP